MNSDLDSPKMPQVVVCPLASQLHSGLSGVVDSNEKQVDLFFILRVLLKRKRLILLPSIVFLVVGIINANTRPERFVSEILVVPNKQSSAKSGGGGGGGGVLQQLGGLSSLIGVSLGESSDSNMSLNLAYLRSRPFLTWVVEKYDLVPVIFPKRKPGGYSAGEVSGAGSVLGGSIKVLPESPPVVRLQATADSPESAAKLVEAVVKGINVFMKEKTIETSTKEVEYITRQIALTDVLEFRQLLYGMVSERKRQIVLAEATDDYVFKVIDPPAGNRVAIKRTLRVSAFFLVGIVLSTIVALVVEYRTNPVFWQKIFPPKTSAS